MADLLKERIIDVNKDTGELTVLKELSENSLNVSDAVQDTYAHSRNRVVLVAHVSGVCTN